MKNDSLNKGILSFKERAINQELAYEFLVKARADFIDSTVLYENKRYEGTIQHLQQSVEKAIKSFLLACGIISKKKLKKISHKSPLGFIEFMKDNGLNLIFKGLPIKNTLSPLECKDKINESLKIDWRKMKYHEMMTHLYLCNDEVIRSIIGKNKSLDPKNIEELKKRLKEEFKVKEEITNDSVWKFAKGLGKLFILAYITFPHFETTRYPGLEIKPSEYNKNSAIVKAFPYIKVEVDSMLSSLEEFFKH